VVTVTSHCLFPSEGLPAGMYPPGITCEWLHNDTREGYLARGGHPLYGEHDVQYSFNSLGYRCPEFSTKADLRIVAIGCSYVFGVGLPQGHLFHERFAAKVRSQFSRTVVLWNLATSGASNDYISRLLLQALPLLDPHIVLVHFTHLCRREYVSIENKVVKYLPSHTPPSAVNKEIYRYFKALSSPYDDELNYFRNYKTVENALGRRCWMYSSPEWHPTPPYVNRDRFVGQLSPIDKARDGDHPGPESNRLLASLYWDKFLTLGGRETFGIR
jgi:hypothetical protein